MTRLFNSLCGRWLAVTSLCVLSACSSAPDKPKPSPLPSVTGSWTVKQAWTNQIGEISTPLMASAQGQQVAVASTAGQLALIDAANGRDVWRLNLGAPIQAGVGGDGQRFAVVTPIGRTLPPSIWLSRVGIEPMYMSTWPPIRSGTACAMPR